ncbi:helix-turn-helix domain-containing protein [Salmonella enterica]|uniref:helix-turn-helix domain-containing protein n=1 Tax=Salmonella enterica TaxID=28901 RepID=UPI0009AAD520|nr:helix-turn-helix domain-containing protein [Salmonella enterica]
MLKTMVVNDILAFIEEKLESELRIETIVEYSGYGRRYTQTLFKKYVRLPVGQYIRERRLTRAAMLLHLTQMPLIDIALRFQFDSQQSFSREFKKLTGCTPLQYRRSEQWDFRHLLPSRTVNEKTPAPLEVKLIAGGDIFGFCVSREEELFSRGSKYRLGYIMRQLAREDGGSVWCLTRATSGETLFDTMMLRTAIGQVDKDKHLLQTRYSYQHGWYAHFRFCGREDEYAEFTTNVYLQLMPVYQLTRAAGADLEIFSLDRDMLICEYYVPVISDSSDRG